MTGDERLSAGPGCGCLVFAALVGLLLLGVAWILFAFGWHLIGGRL